MTSKPKQKRPIARKPLPANASPQAHSLIDPPKSTPKASLQQPSPPAQHSAQQYLYQRPDTQAQLSQSYFIMDADKGIPYYPDAQTSPLARPISPPAALSPSYEFLGVPIVTSYNPMERAKEVIVQRYSQEFQGMSSIGEGMIMRLVDMDLEREGRGLEALVWRNASHEELARFSERLMRGLE
ncbi:hypothetical protein NA56DRAFT_707187 [Hyaloscypha hepaticicola]|uniref:Uncharacterized protein n=1 Tax=Hyaloscypha hepaticicola TaxID=2082293 RepID=A0A2J6PVT5_9HELO|nr:hypothetical protein NA56DRAFT_707187 [Hyaloscypha hepaticicola]